MHQNSSTVSVPLDWRRFATAEASFDKPEQRSHTLLAVDTDQDFLRQLVEFGRRNFVEVRTANSGEQAMAALSDPALDALLVAIDLDSSFDTFGFVREQRGRASVNRMPFGLISADETVAQRMLGVELGARVFVAKPLEASHFDYAVQRLVGDGRAPPPRIILVGESVNFLDETASTLREAGMLPIVIDTAAEVVERIDDLAPQALIAAADMPGLDGVGLTRMLRATPQWHDLPILLFAEKNVATRPVAVFQSGADDYLIGPVFEEELLARLRARLDRLHLMRQRAEVDPLTGLLSRRPFLRDLSARLSSAERDCQPASLALLDVDDFKNINDTHGHVAGDRVLSAVGRLLQHRFREDDLRCRWGGEEFLVAMVAQDAADAGKAVKRALDELRRMVFVSDDGECFAVTLSCGLACFPLDGREFMPLLQIADERLYHAKHSGKNRIVSAATEHATG